MQLVLALLASEQNTNRKISIPLLYSMGIALFLYNHHGDSGQSCMLYHQQKEIKYEMKTTNQTQC